MCIESAKTVNEMTLNELVKLTTLCTTGPRSLLIKCEPDHIKRDHMIFRFVVLPMRMHSSLYIGHRNAVLPEGSSMSLLHVCEQYHITKTRLFKYIENFTSKNGKLSDKKNSDIFHISAQNIDCGYSLEPPLRGGSNEYPQSVFCAEIRKIIYTPVNPSFTI